MIVTTDVVRVDILGIIKVCDPNLISMCSVDFKYVIRSNQIVTQGGKSEGH